MKSHSGYTFFFKHIFLQIALITSFVGVMGYLFPDSVTVNGEPSEFDIYDYTIIGGISLLGIILQLLFGPHFVNVKLGGQNIIVLDYEAEEVINWMNVESLTKFWIIFPPLYKLKIKNEEGYYLFTTQPAYFDIGIGTVDLSSMGNLIERKKRELGI